MGLSKIHRMNRKLQLAHIRSEQVMVASGEETNWREPAGLCMLVSFCGKWASEST